jgi:nicotinate-nucleotide adenylyltransferase
MVKIGIMGGSFDPPHTGHLALARAAMAQLELDEILWIPAGRNPLKTRRTVPGKQRLEMVQLAIENEPNMAASDIEIGRSGPSYTYDTLFELQHVHPGQYWLILGADALKDFDKWKSPERILKMARLAVVVRPPHGRHELENKMTDELRAAIDWLEMPPVDVSSTEIRLRSEEKRPFAHLLPSKVYDYIKKHKLYGL